MLRHYDQVERQPDGSGHCEDDACLACPILFVTCFHSDFHVSSHVTLHRAQMSTQKKHWDSMKPVLMRAFAHAGAQKFSDKNCSRLIHDGSTKKTVSELFRDTLVVFQVSRTDEIHAYSTRLERVPLLSQRKSMVFSVYSGGWNNSGRKRGGHSSPSSHSDTIESFRKGRGRG